MDALGYSDDYQNSKNSKGVKIVLIVLIVLLTIAVIGIVMAIIYFESQQLKINIDQVSAVSKQIFCIDENTKEVDISIEKMAKEAGYKFYYGEYGQNNEIKTKCYIENENEVTTFELNSNVIYKRNLKTETEWEKFEIDKPIRSLDGELIVSSTGAKVTHNMQFNYDLETNTITVYTLPFLFVKYNEKIIAEGVYTGLDENYNNMKTILYDMLTVVRLDKKVGVIGIKNENVIGIKYDSLSFIEETKEFYATTNKKTGILNKDGNTKIKLEYDEVKLLDKALGLWYVSNNKLQGVLDTSGNEVIYLEYNAIGIDSSMFPRENIKNSFILFDKLIPAKQNTKWGMFDKKGKIVIPFEYDSFGYGTTKSTASSTTPNSTSNNLLTIPEYGLIVTCNGKLYGLININGQVISVPKFDKIYSVTKSGKPVYYMEILGKTETLDDYINSYTAGEEKDTDISEIENNNQNNNNENQNNQNNNQNQENQNENQENQENNNQNQNNNQNNEQQNNGDQQQQGQQQ